MLMDYLRSPVGPYRELLFIPAISYRRPASITKIYVSSRVSLQNGRRNWGIPKQLARFELREQARGRERVRVSVGDALVLQLELSSAGLRLPFTSRLLPRRLTTLCQSLDGQVFTTAPAAYGLVRMATVHAVQVDPRLFPTFSASQVVAVLELSRTTLVFPPADIRRQEQS
jgi:hypothetical protein